MSFVCFSLFECLFASCSACLRLGLGLAPGLHLLRGHLAVGHQRGELVLRDAGGELLLVPGGAHPLRRGATSDPIGCEGIRMDCGGLVGFLGPRGVPFYPFWGEGSPTKIDYRKKGYLYSNLSTGGPSFTKRSDWVLLDLVLAHVASFLGGPPVWLTIKGKPAGNQPCSFKGKRPAWYVEG